MVPPNAAQKILPSVTTTLLPFLYQTRTILGRVPRSPFAGENLQIRRIRVARNIAKRRHRSDQHASADEGAVNHVPFETEQEAAFHQQRKSTITETERETFEKLFRKYNAKTSANSTPWGDTDSNMKGSPDDTLDSILDEAMSSAKSDPTDPAASFRVSSGARRDLMRTTAIYHEEEDTIVKKAQRKEQFERVEQLLKAAKSDIELWNVLEAEVLSVIRRLDLDAPRPPPTVEGDTDFSSTLEIIGPNYASLMLVAIRQLRVDFPGSTLGLALLPAIKSLGRGSYALGASTELYNELLAMTWLTYSDFQGLEDLLQEMENGGIDFNGNTLDLLDSIKRNAFNARKGGLGEGASVVLEMDRFKRGTRRLQRWRDAIRMRMEAEVIRQAKEKELVL